MNFNIKHILLLLTLLTGLSACEKMVDVDPPVNQLVSASIFTDSLTAQAAMNGVYSLMYNGSGQLVQNVYSLNTTFLPAKSADEIYIPTSSSDEFILNSLSISNGTVAGIWNDSYRLVYNLNSLIEGMESSSLSPTLKVHLIAEAKFLRAFIYFTIVNTFGDVPLVTTTNVEVNNVMARTSMATVYAQIIADLKEAQTGLAVSYSWSQNNRTRANQGAATAMLARVHLYIGNWAEAEAEATKVIGQSIYGLSADLKTVFLKASTEAIWQFSANQNGYTFIGNTLLPNGNIAPQNVLTPQLMDAFEDDDKRSTNWVKVYTSETGTYPYAYKYTTKTLGTNTENDLVLRLAEQYLIRAEARAKQNNFSGSASDLNVIRRRAGLPNTTASTRETLLPAIAHERQVELFVEWGHRWFDLKRTGQATTVLSTVKGTGWQSTDVLYPIPESSILINSNLTQNDGY